MNIQQLMEQAKAMEAKMKALQEEMASVRIEGRSGGGMVRVVLAGNGALIEVSIDPSLMKESEREILEDLIKAAHADAVQKKEDMIGEQTGKMFGGMGLPGGFKLPF